jgi:hypothetical protein
MTGAVVELAGRLDIAVPTLAAVHALIQTTDWAIRDRAGRSRDPSESDRAERLEKEVS